MKNLIILICLMAPMIAVAQKENDNYKLISDGLIRLLNNENYKGIYDMYSPVLRKFQGPAESEKYLAANHAKYGKISDCKFLKFQQNFGVYEVTGEKGTFLLRISLDDQKRLVALNISPKE